MMSETAFRDFADWRLQVYRDRPRESVRFFRSSLDHSMIWMLVMRGHFDDHAPTVGECQGIGRCSPLTTRKLIGDAVALGYFEIRTDSADHRKRSVHPTERTITEYVEMVQGYAAIFESIVTSEPMSVDVADRKE